MDAFRILSYGIVGLGFLLALLAYRLIHQVLKPEGRTLTSNVKTTLFSFMGFSIVLCLIGLGSEFLNKNDSTTDCPACETEKENLKAQTNSLQALVAEGIYASDLVQISDTHFDSSSIKKPLLQEIRNVINEMKENERQFGYKLFKIEQIISSIREGIDTRSPIQEDDSNKDKKMEAFRLIQDVLRELKDSNGKSFYQGRLNDDRKPTYEAISTFQTYVNKQDKNVRFDSTDLGLFGHGTIEAARSVKWIQEKKN